MLIGGAPTDVQAAHAAGARAIGYANKPRKLATDADADADAIVTRMNLVAEAITRLSANQPRPLWGYSGSFPAVAWQVRMAALVTAALVGGFFGSVVGFTWRSRPRSRDEAAERRGVLRTQPRGASAPFDVILASRIATFCYLAVVAAFTLLGVGVCLNIAFR